MWGHWYCLKVWELVSHLNQLFFGEGSCKFVLVGNVGSDILLGAQFLCLIKGDKLHVKLGPEDMLRRSKIVGVDIVSHGRREGCIIVQVEGMGNLPVTSVLICTSTVGFRFLNSLNASGACTSPLSTHSLSESGYPFHLIRYCSLHLLLNRRESRIFSTSYSS